MEVSDVMLSRILVAIVGIPFLIAVLLLFPPIVLPVVLALLCAIAVHEALYATGAVRHKGIIGAAMVLALFIPFWLYFGGNILVGMCAVFLFWVALCMMTIASDQTVTFGQMGMAFVSGLIIPMLLSSFVLIADLEHEKFLILLPFVSAFTSDAFALFAGMAFGKHKLAPKLSPKKTVEGSVGGFAGSVLCCVAYGLLVQAVWGFQPNFPVLALYGLVASLVSQLGDLSFSYIKREFGIKDYGHLLPGHGGVLDRFDSVIFCAPFTYIMVVLLPFFRF
jgi:phosphatidate cytidylyltransferase